MAEETISVETLNQRIAPLDLLLFRGTDLCSKIIQLGQEYMVGNGKFSHVGLVVNSKLLPTIPQLEKGKWYVWESTASTTSEMLSRFIDNAINVETEKGKIGVQIRDLSAVIPSYIGKGGQVAWARLKNNPWDAPHRGKLVRRVCDVHKIYGNRRYDANAFALLGSIFPFLRKPRDVFEKVCYKGEYILTTIKEHFDEENEHPEINEMIEGANPARWIFCSELVAIVYQQIGIIDKNLNPADVIPSDLIGFDKDGIPVITEGIRYIGI